MFQKNSMMSTKPSNDFFTSCVHISGDDVWDRELISDETLNLHVWFTKKKLFLIRVILIVEIFTFNRKKNTEKYIIMFFLKLNAIISAMTRSD